MRRGSFNVEKEGSPMRGRSRRCRGKKIDYCRATRQWSVRLFRLRERYRATNRLRYSIRRHCGTSASSSRQRNRLSWPRSGQHSWLVRSIVCEDSRSCWASMASRNRLRLSTYRSTSRRSKVQLTRRVKR